MDKKTLINLIKAAGVKKVAVGAVSLTLVTGGFNVLWKDYQQGNLFKPDMLVKNRELQGNQIMFPEKENMKPDEENNSQENDNKKLERDPESNDPYGQDKQNDSSYEMAMDQVTQNPENTGNIYADSSYPYAGNINSPSGNPDGQNLVLAPDAEEKVRVPGGYSEIPENNIHNNETPSSGGISDSSSTVVDGNSGGGGGASSGTNQDPVTPGGNADPAPNPDPAPTPTPDQPSGKPDSGDNTPVVDPDFPDASNPPKPATDPTWPDGESIYTGRFPGDGFPKNSEQAEKAQIHVVQNLTNTEFELYEGTVLTDWKLFCSLYAYVSTDPGVNYRIQNYSENFKVGDYPKIVNGDFTVKFYFRPNAQSPWQETECTFSVKYCKVTIMNIADESGERETLETIYFERGKKLDLVKLLKTLYDYNYDNWEKDTFWDNSLQSIVPGWIVNGNEKIFTPEYEPAAPGRYEIIPMEREKVSDQLAVILEDQWKDPSNFNSTTFYVQKLIYAPEESEVLEIPLGIQKIGIWPSYTYNARKLIIPESVAYVEDYFPVIQNEIVVSDKNQHFCSDDGLLYDKSKTKLIAVPSDRTELKVPETVKEVVLSSANANLKEIVFTASTPPDITLENLSGVTLYVPSNAYAQYLLAWNQQLGDNHLEIAGEVADYMYEDSAVYSSDKKILYLISDENSGLWMVPDGVEKIKNGATDKCTDVERLFIPGSMKNLESGSLAGNGLKEIYFQGTVPPDISEDTFGNLTAKGLVVYVPEGCRDAYVEKWSEVLGQDTVEKLIQYIDCKLVEDGDFIYLDVSDRSILMQAPKDVVSFDEIMDRVPENVKFAEIGNSAFKGCDSLKVAELPESVVRIGRNAFSQCKNLEGVMSYATQGVFVGKDAFENLRFLAFNTGYLDLEDPSMINGINTYVTNSCLLDETAAKKAIGSGTSLKMGDTEETKGLVFGLGKDQGNEAFVLSWDSDFSGILASPDEYPITLIMNYAFMGCDKTIIIPDDVAKTLRVIGWEAFEDSGLTGSIAFSDDLHTIGANAFYGCSELDKVTFSGTEHTLGDTDPGLTIDEMAFLQTGLTEIEFPEDLKALGCHIFAETNVSKMIFKGKNVPALLCYSTGSPYFFGVENEENTIELKGEADADTYLKRWKYQLSGVDSIDQLIPARGTYLWYNNAAMSAYWEWYDEVGEFPDKEDGGYVDEFYEYVDACLNYEAEKTIADNMKRFYILIGKGNTEVPFKAEKPAIKDYVDKWEQRVEEENKKKESALQKKEDLLEQVKSPLDEIKKPEQGNEVLKDPSKAEGTVDPENPDTPETPDGSEENPENPDKDKPSETPENPDKDNEESKDPSEAPDDPQSPSETPGDSDKDPQSPDENGNSGSTPDNGAESGKEEENAGSESAGGENASGESSGSESAGGGQEGSSENNTTENNPAENAQEDEGADHQNG